MISLILSLVLSQAAGSPGMPGTGGFVGYYGPFSPLAGFAGQHRSGTRNGSSSYFEFAPANGEGMGQACACADVTPATGGILFVFRATNAVCLKQGLARTLLTEGDAVTCGNNLPRIESDGTALGLLTEPFRLNRLQQSNNVAAAPWGLASGGGAAGSSATPAYAPGLDGVANSASRLTVGACPTVGAAFSLAFQGYTATGLIPQSASAFFKGTSGSGTIAMYLYDGTSGVQITCSYNPTTWTWCGGPGAQLVYTPISVGMQIGIGCTNTSIPGFSNTGAADVLVWGVNMQEGSYPTNPIITTSAIVSRNAELSNVYQDLVTDLPFPGAPFSLSAYFTPQTASGSSVAVAIFDGLYNYVDQTTDGTALTIRSNDLRFTTNQSGSSTITYTPAYTAGSTHMVGGVNVAGQSTIYYDGVIVAGPTATNTANAFLSPAIGNAALGTESASGIISRVCFDSSTTRCVQ